jgi:hypothetical protein
MTGTDERFRQGRFGAASPGVRPERPSLEDLLTAPQKPAGRRRWMIALAIALAAVLAGSGGYLLGRFTAPAQPSLVRLLVTTTALPAGARLIPADLGTVTVERGDHAPADSLGTAAEPGLLGLAPRMAVPSGTFVTRSLLTAASAVPGRAVALVGLALKPGQLPSAGLAPGEQVLIVLVPSSPSAGSTALALTTVWDVQGSAASGMTLATVMVPATIATRLAGYAARGEIALVATGAARVPASANSAPAAHITPSVSHSKPATKPSSKTSSKTSTKQSNR